MSELDKLNDSVKDKSVNTQKSYKTQYNKLVKLLGKPVSETSEKKLIEIVLERTFFHKIRSVTRKIKRKFKRRCKREKFCITGYIAFL